MAKLVNQSDIVKVTRLDKIGLGGLAGLIMNVLKLKDINELYERHQNHSGVEFIDALFEEIKIEFDFFKDELERIPKTGPFITISNHPLGGIDGLILIKLVSLVRPDFKVMANFLLKNVTPIKDYFLSVNPFEDKKDLRSSFSGIKESMQYVSEGHGLGIFPAGEVSTYNIEEQRIVDKEWEESALKMIKKMQVPVVPIFFKARNSRLFYLLALLHPTLRTAKLPSEILSQKNKSIRIRIGKPISIKEQLEFSDIKAYSAFLRSKTLMLSKTIEAEKQRIITLTLDKPEALPQPIADETPAHLIESEIAGLREIPGTLLTESRGLEVFLAKASQIPNILQEIGRLREITFRDVGEGTNNPTDLDEYDAYYHHLFLWDKATSKIAGAYRLGMGADIYNQSGIKGFYIPTLFKVERELHYLFYQGIEMGRAFVVKEFQQKPMPLFLLWKGIVHVILRNPEKVKYLTGCVSISNHFTRFSKSLMVEFVKQHFYDAETAAMVKPKKEFKGKLGKLERAFLNSFGNDLNKFDKLIEELEPGSMMRFPVLLKKYIKQNARVIGFNVDPKFNNAVDGLMYIDIQNLPEQTLQPVLEELESATKQEFSQK
jgi:putative hemolysin